MSGIHISKQRNLFFLFLLICRLQIPVFAQSPALDEATFRAMSPSARLRFVHDFSFRQMDTAAVENVLDRMLVVAQEENDSRSYIAVKFRRYEQRETLRPKVEEMLANLADMEKEARKSDLEMETIAAHLYSTFEQFKSKKIPREQMYAELRISFGEMEALGFDRFRDYKPGTMFYILIKFMQDIEDYEESFRYLTAAERVVEPSKDNYRFYTLFLNYLQGYWEQKKDYAKAIEYAQKILHFYRHLPPGISDREVAWRSRFWQGFSSLSIAKTMLLQGRREEVERYADQGYAWSKVETANSPRAAYIGEYEALQMYIPIKLEFGKLAEAGVLLKRSQEIKDYLGVGWDISIFKHIKFYENFALYEEILGHSAAALRYTKLARNLQDSLDRRNDVRKFEQINQRLAADKYTEQLRLVESEKEFQKLLRNAAFLLLALMVLLTYVWLQRQRRLRRQKEAELEASKKELVSITTGFREKSDLLETLRLELEQLSANGERSQALAQLTQLVILTEENWVQFRTLFEQVYPGFIAAQKASYPHLTPAELRMLLLEKLDLNATEMANMLGVSTNTIYKTGQRLRKKLQ